MVAMVLNEMLRVYFVDKAYWFLFCRRYLRRCACIIQESNTTEWRIRFWKEVLKDEPWANGQTLYRITTMKPLRGKAGEAMLWIDRWCWGVRNEKALFHVRVFNLHALPNRFANMSSCYTGNSSEKWSIPHLLPWFLPPGGLAWEANT